MLREGLLGTSIAVFILRDTRIAVSQEFAFPLICPSKKKWHRSHHNSEDNSFWIVSFVFCFMWLILMTVLLSEKRYEELYACIWLFPSVPCHSCSPYSPKLDLLQGWGSSQKENVVSITETVEQEGFVLLPEGTGYPCEKGKGEEAFYNPGSSHLIHINGHLEASTIIPMPIDALPVT